MRKLSVNPEICDKALPLKSVLLLGDRFPQHLGITRAVGRANPKYRAHQKHGAHLEKEDFQRAFQPADSI